jgi:hypothetical protein
LRLDGSDAIRAGSMRSRYSPFRDDLALAFERAERLARENALLRARLSARPFDWWSSLGRLDLVERALLLLVTLIIGLSIAALVWILWPLR